MQPSDAGADGVPSEPIASGAEALSRLPAGSESDALQSNPQLQSFLACWLDTFIFNGHIDPRLRELAILRVMWRCRQQYEWGNHYRLARNAGLSKAEILSIRTPDLEHDLHGDVAVVVRAADDIVDRGHLTADTFAAVRDVFTDPGVQLEFLYLVAGYRMFASVGAITHRTSEALGFRPWPPDGVGPEGWTDDG